MPHNGAGIADGWELEFRLELTSNSEQKAENIFVAPPYCQTAVSYSTLQIIDSLNRQL